MSRYKNRSYEAELMDLPFERKEDLFENLEELELINKLTGGPATTFRQLKKILSNHTGEVHIVDVGFGAGDMLQYILDHQAELPCKVRLTGVDLLPEAKEYAIAHHPELEQKANLKVQDYRDFLKENNKVDIVLAGLFCHHLTDEQLVEFFKYIEQYAKISGIINDLHRHPIAYYGIKIPTQLFSRSRFTKNDAPLSVLRGFKNHELKKILHDAKVSNFDLSWKWAFRYILTIYGRAK
jgi:2-polyprenyl-3-methyl-5-hydroxy-6-metoxy-1,4-benzoquinol methylase